MTARARGEPSAGLFYPSEEVRGGLWRCVLLDASGHAPDNWTGLRALKNCRNQPRSQGVPAADPNRAEPGCLTYLVLLVGFPALWAAACVTLDTLPVDSIGFFVAVPAAVSFVVLAARRVYLPVAIVVAAVTAGLTLGYLVLVFLLSAPDGWAS